jgi:hypothetical protein
MITRVSSVIRPEGSDLIFDHPYNADSALCGYRVQVAFAAVPIAGYGCHPGWLRVSAYRLGCGSGWSAQGGRYRGGRRERRLVAVSRLLQGLGPVVNCSAVVLAEERLESGPAGARASQAPAS